MPTEISTNLGGDAVRNENARLRDIINLEAFLFRGVPERPTAVFGGDANDNVIVRQTRGHFLPVPEADVRVESRPLYLLAFDPETGCYATENSA